MVNHESEITTKLSKIPSCKGWEKLKDIKKLQIKFLVDSINNNLFIRQGFRDCINDIFKCTSIKITSKPNIEIGSGLVVITNHIGVNKLTKIYPWDIERADESKSISLLPRLENDDPFILLLAPVIDTIFKSIKKSDELELIFVFMKLAQVYDNVLQSINAVTIDRNAPNQYGFLKNKISEKIKLANNSNKKPVLIVFPEGGTSGKSNLADPYTLLKFKDGYKRLSKDFQLGIVPIAISIDSDINFFASIGHYLSADSTVDEDREYFTYLLKPVHAS